MSEKLSETDRALVERVMGPTWARLLKDSSELAALLNAARAEARPAPAVDREAVAEIISGAPFPSARSLAKADAILALLSPAAEPPSRDNAGGGDTQQEDDHG